MTDIERRLRDLGERVREEQGSDFPSPAMKDRIRARRFSAVAVASLLLIAAVATGTFAAGWVGNGPVSPAGPGGSYSVEIPAEVWVMGEHGFLEAPALNLAWGRDSETAETLACVGMLPPETSLVDLVHAETGVVLSWDDNFVSEGDMATVCSHNLDTELLVEVANNPSEYRLVIDGDLVVQLVRTWTTPTSEPTATECGPPIDFAPTYLPPGWVPELQEGSATGEDAFGNIAGHYGVEGTPGAHRKIDAGFIDVVAPGFRYEPPSEGDLIVLGEPAEFDKENGTIEFGANGCAYVLVGAGVGREELVPFAEGLRPKGSADDATDQESEQSFAAIWPEDSEDRAGEECTSIQHVDGHWRSDAVRTAEQFTTDVLGWEEALAVQSKRQEGFSIYVGNGPISSDTPTVVVHVDELFGGCWSVISVSRLPEEQPKEDGSMSVRGRDVQMGFDIGDAASATFEVGYSGKKTTYTWEGGQMGVEFRLDFEPQGTGHFLVLLRDANGEVFSAFGSPLPEGDFAAG